MGTRIFVQGIHTEAHPTKGADGYAVMNDGMRRVYETVLRPDTEVAMHFVPRTTFMTNHAYLALLNNAELVRGVIDADRNIRHFGLTDKAIAHRPARTPVGPAWVDLVREGVTWFESPDFVHERVVPAFEEVARSCIDDGAEVIVTGCAMFAAFTLAGYRFVTGTDVPVVDSVAVGIKAAEMQGDLYRSLGLSHSKHLTYRDEVPETLRASIDAQWFPDRA